MDRLARMENRHCPPAPEAPCGSRWRTLGRWLLLLLIVFDLATSPFHHHGHDLGAAQVNAPLPHVAAATPDTPPDLSSGPVASAGVEGHRLQLDSAPATGFTHSQALLRAAETRHDSAPLLTLVLGLALLAAAWALLEAPRGWPFPALATAPAWRPPGLLPDGRAPPRLLA